MAIITNSSNLNQSVADVASLMLGNSETRPSNEFFVGELHKSAQELVLARQNVPTIDASNAFVRTIRALYKHKVIENLDPMATVKTPLKAYTWLGDNNELYKGSVDFYVKDTNEIVAIKVGKVYGFKACQDGSDPTYYNEMVLNSIMMRECLGIVPDKMTVLYGILDYSVSDARTKQDYPAHELMTISWDTPKMSKEDEKIFLNPYFAKASLVSNYLKGNAELPPCTDDETWAKVSYALKKPANKTNTCKGSMEKIEEAWSNLKDKDKEIMEVHKITSYPKNCFLYCPYADVCKQHQSYLEKGGAMEDTIMDITSEFKRTH